MLVKSQFYDECSRGVCHCAKIGYIMLKLEQIVIAMEKLDIFSMKTSHTQLSLIFFEFFVLIRSHPSTSLPPARLSIVIHRRFNSRKIIPPRQQSKSNLFSSIIANNLLMFLMHVRSNKREWVWVSSRRLHSKIHVGKAYLKRNRLINSRVFASKLDFSFTFPFPLSSALVFALWIGCEVLISFDVVCWYERES